MLSQSLLVYLSLISVLLNNIVSAANCDLQENCEKCLGVDECAWCESTSVDSYCFDAISNAGRCSEYGDKVLQFHEKKSVIVASQPLWFESILGDKMQIKPQYMREIHKIGLSRAINTSFEFEYSIADNAIDIYYLVDVTTFSSRDKRHLIRLGRKLVTTMGKMSKNVRIGFGVINRSDDEASKCTKDQCNRKTRFVHLMNLSPDTSYFTQLLQNISITNTERKDSNNLALVVQAIICEKNIGWRNDARRILVISTNSATSYLNGDEYGWNVESDISCGVDEAGYYELTESNADVNFKTVLKEADKHSVGLVVAVPSNVYREHLAYNNSANVVEIVKNHYESIRSHLQMEHNATDGINVRFFTECNRDSPKLERSHERSRCHNVRKGDVIKFRVLIEVPSAESYHNFYQTIGIYARGKEDQRLSVQYNVTYRCPCENCDIETGTDAPVPVHEDCDLTTRKNYCVNDLGCNNRGKCVCGSCQCDDSVHYFGNNCECVNSTEIALFGCGEGDKCSNNGMCVCGKCECFATPDGGQYHGKFCECSDSDPACEDSSGNLCSGSDHGKCICGKCLCNSPYSGHLCQYGATADQSGDRCNELKNCVECEMYKTGELSEEECQKCDIDPIAAPSVEESAGTVLCEVKNSDDCEFSFTYNRERWSEVVAQEELSCPKKWGNWFTF